MTEASRRRFIGVAGAGAAAAGAATVLPGTAVGRELLRRDAANESIVAHVSDVQSELVTLMVGEREVVVRDVELVTRLRNAAGAAATAAAARIAAADGGK